MANEPHAEHVHDTVLSRHVSGRRAVFPRRDGFGIDLCLTGDLAAQSPEDRAFNEALCSAAPKLSQAAKDIRAFADLLRQNDSTGLTPWLKASAATDLDSFVTGLLQDPAAVRAATVEPWSNSPVKRQVNRPKLIKRSMYGRARSDLLRQRVLHAT